MGAAGSRAGPISAVRIVHAGGRVEMFFRPVTAHEVMLQNPRHWVTKPEVFRSDVVDAVIPPHTILMPGQKFFLVPFDTVHSLIKRQNHTPSDHHRSRKASPLASGRLQIEAHRYPRVYHLLQVKDKRKTPRNNKNWPRKSSRTPKRADVVRKHKERPSQRGGNDKSGSSDKKWRERMGRMEQGTNNRDGLSLLSSFNRGMKVEDKAESAKDEEKTMELAMRDEDQRPKVMKSDKNGDPNEDSKGGGANRCVDRAEAPLQKPRCITLAEHLLASPLIIGPNVPDFSIILDSDSGQKAGDGGMPKTIYISSSAPCCIDVKEAGDGGTRSAVSAPSCAPRCKDLRQSSDGGIRKTISDAPSSSSGYSGLQQEAGDGGMRNAISAPSSSSPKSEKKMQKSVKFRDTMLKQSNAELVGFRRLGAHPPDTIVDLMRLHRRARRLGQAQFLCKDPYLLARIKKGEGEKPSLMRGASTPSPSSSSSPSSPSSWSSSSSSSSSSSPPSLASRRASSGARRWKPRLQPLLENSTESPMAASASSASRSGFVKRNPATAIAC